MKVRHMILGAAGLAGGLVLWRRWRRRPRALATPAMRLGGARSPTARSGSTVTRSRVDAYGTVIESPAELFALARKVDPELTLDEYTAARLAASEHGSGSL